MDQESYKPRFLRSRRRRIFRAIGVQLYRHSAIAMVGLVLLTALTLLSAARLEVSSDLRSFVPMDADERVAWSEAARRTDFDTEPVVAVVRPAAADVASATPAALAEFASHLSQSLDESGVFSKGVLHSVVWQVLRPDVNRDGAAPAWPGAEMRLRRIARDLHADGETGLLFLLRPSESQSHPAYCVTALRTLEQCFEAVAGASPNGGKQWRLEVLGRHARTARRALALKRAVTREGVIALVCLGLLLILAFRKAESLVFVGLPPLVGLIWTWGLMGCFLDRVSLLGALFTLLLLALGLEYAVQIYHRFIEELYRKERYYPALELAYTEAGRGIFVSMLATSLIFVSLLLSRYHNLRELALAGGLGAFSMAAAALLLLPPLAAAKSALAKGRVRPERMFGFGLRRLSDAAMVSPRTTLALCLAVTVYLGFYCRQIRINREPGLGMIGGEDPADARQRPFLYQGDLRVSFLLEGEDEWSLMQTAERLRQRFEALPAAHRPADIEVRPGWAGSPEHNRSYAPLVPDMVPGNDRRHRTVVDVFAQRGEGVRGLRRALGQDFEKVAAALHDGPVRVTAEYLENRRVAETVIYSMALTIALTFLWLTVCLLPHFHGRWDEALLAQAPLVVGAVWGFGLFRLFGQWIGLHALLVVPIAVGVAVDQSILLIQRLHDRRHATVRQVMRAGGRPGALTAFGVVLVLGSLAWVGFPALREMALAALVVVALSSLALTVLLPVLLQIREQGDVAEWLAAWDE